MARLGEPRGVGHRRGPRAGPVAGRRGRHDDSGRPRVVKGHRPGELPRHRRHERRGRHRGGRTVTPRAAVPDVPKLLLDQDDGEFVVDGVLSAPVFVPRDLAMLRSGSDDGLAVRNRPRPRPRRPQGSAHMDAARSRSVDLHPAVAVATPGHHEPARDAARLPALTVPHGARLGAAVREMGRKAHVVRPLVAGRGADRVAEGWWTRPCPALPWPPAPPEAPNPLRGIAFAVVAVFCVVAVLGAVETGIRIAATWRAAWQRLLRRRVRGTSRHDRPTAPRHRHRARGSSALTLAALLGALAVWTLTRALERAVFDPGPPDGRSGRPTGPSS